MSCFFVKPLISARRRRIPWILKALHLVPLIRDMNDVDLLRMAEAVKIETFRKGTTVSRQVSELTVLVMKGETYR